MSVSVDVSTPTAAVSTATGTTVTSPSFSPPAGSIVLVGLVNDQAGTAFAGVSDSLAAHLGWKKLVGNANSAWGISTEWWYAPVSTAPGSMTITATAGTSVPAGDLVIYTYVLKGAGGVQMGATFSTTETGAAASGSLPLAKGSLGFALIDANSLTAPTALSGQFISGFKTFSDEGSGSYVVEMSSSQTSAGSVTLGTSAPTSIGAGAQILCIEIQPGSVIAVDSSSPAIAVNGAAGTTVTSASFTPPQGSLIVVGVVAEGQTTGLTGVSDNLANHLSWTKILSNSDSAALIEFWCAYVPRGATPLTVTATAATSTAAGNLVMYTMVWTGAKAWQLGDAVTFSGSSAPSLNATMVSTNSQIMSLYSYNSLTAPTLASGFTDTVNGTNTVKTFASGDTGFLQVLSNPSGPAGGVFQTGFTAPSSIGSGWLGAAIEIEALPGSIDFVQELATARSFTPSGTTFTQTLTQNATPGNQLIVDVTAGGGHYATNCVDAYGNTWVNDGNIGGSGGTHRTVTRFRCLQDVQTLSVGDLVTVTMSASATALQVAGPAEYVGIGTATVGPSGSSGSSSVTNITTTITPASQTDGIIAAATSAGGTVTATTNLTQRTSITSIATGDDLTPGAVATNVTFHIPSSQTMAISAWAYSFVPPPGAMPSSYSASASDSVTVGDVSASRLMHAGRSLADSVTVADSVTRTSTRPRTAHDTVTIADSDTRTRGGSRTAGDHVTIADSVAGHGGRARTAADSVVVADSGVGARGTTVAAADNVPITDAAGRIGHVGKTAGDSVTVGDSNAEQMGKTVSAHDTVAVTDHGGGLVVLSQTAADAVTVADAASEVVGRARSAQDAVVVGDQPAGHSVGKSRGASDDVNVVDSAGRKVGVVLSVADHVTVSDNAKRIEHRGLKASDHVVVAEGFTIAHAGRARHAQDSVTVSDIAYRMFGGRPRVVDHVIVSDEVANLLHGYGRTARDEVAVTDRAGRTYVTGIGAQDAVEISDSVLAIARLIGEQANISVSDALIWLVSCGDVGLFAVETGDFQLNTVDVEEKP